jgi:hypothetical protein
MDRSQLRLLRPELRSPPVTEDNTDSLSARGIVTVAVCALILALQLILLAYKLPVFHHIDEAYHVDYVLKLLRGQPLATDSQVEPEIVDWLVSNKHNDAEYYYLGRIQQRSEINTSSYELYQSSLPYRLSAGVLRLTAGFTALQLDVDAITLALRLQMVCMIVAAKSWALAWAGFWQSSIHSGFQSIWSDSPTIRPPTCGR